MLDASLGRRSAAVHGRNVSLQGLHLGFLCVVIIPAVFWSLVVFAIVRHEGSSLALHASIVFFTVAAIFLNFICTALKVRN